MLQPVTPVDTRGMFRPVSDDLVTLLRALSPAAWQRPTVAGAWLVRDIVAHLLDTTLRRLSFHRDRMAPPAPPGAIASEREFVEFINRLNAEWVGAARRLSPRVLTDLYDAASRAAADWFESQPLDGPALFAVSWAGERESSNWFDIGRDFTELWHHQQQIRMAVGADPLPDPRYLHAVLDLGVRALPFAYRNVLADAGQAVTLEVSGSAGGEWTLMREADGWSLWRGAPDAEATRVRVEQDAAWRLLFNALPESDAAHALSVTGDTELARPLLRARSVIV